MTCRPDFYGELTPGEHERLAEALAIQTQLSTLVCDLRAQLHAAGLEPVGQRWARIGVAA